MQQFCAPSSEIATFVGVNIRRGAESCVRSIEPTRVVGMAAAKVITAKMMTREAMVISDGRTRSAGVESDNLPDAANAAQLQRLTQRRRRTRRSNRGGRRERGRQ